MNLFPFTNGYKHLQPKVSGCIPTKICESPHLCTVEMKQLQYQKSKAMSISKKITIINNN